MTEIYTLPLYHVSYIIYHISYNVHGTGYTLATSHAHVPGKQMCLIPCRCALLTPGIQTNNSRYQQLSPSHSDSGVACSSQTAIAEHFCAVGPMDVETSRFFPIRILVLHAHHNPRFLSLFDRCGASRERTNSPASLVQ